MLYWFARPTGAASEMYSCEGPLQWEISDHQASIWQPGFFHDIQDGLKRIADIEQKDPRRWVQMHLPQTAFSAQKRPPDLRSRKYADKIAHLFFRKGEAVDPSKLGFATDHDGIIQLEEDFRITNMEGLRFEKSFLEFFRPIQIFAIPRRIDVPSRTDENFCFVGAKAFFDQDPALKGREYSGMQEKDGLSGDKAQERL